MALPNSYYRVKSARESDTNGYEECYGHGPRYFWTRTEANVRAAELNNPEGPVRDDDLLAGTYSVERRQIYADGRWDDEDDDYAREQLGI